MNQPVLPNIVKQWTRRRGFLCLQKDSIEVKARQLLYESDPLRTLAIARVTIKVNNICVHRAEIRIPMPIGEIMLALQVYTLSQQPKYRHAKWQALMEKFAYRCKGFTTKGLTIHWNTSNSQVS